MGKSTVLLASASTTTLFRDHSSDLCVASEVCSIHLI